MKLEYNEVTCLANTGLTKTHAASSSIATLVMKYIPRFISV